MSRLAFIDRIGTMSQPYDKSNLKLDFDSRGVGNTRKSKFLGFTSPALLQSPDLKRLKLGSPELERLILNNNGFLPTPTPGGGTSSFLQMGENNMEDREKLSLGFIEALEKLHQQQPVTWDASKSESYLATTTSVISPTKWLDHNRNPVGVTTPVITNRFDTQSPPIPKLTQSTTSSINFSTTSTGIVSSMGQTALQSSSSYLSRPHTSVLTHSSLAQQGSSHLITTPGMTLPTQLPLSNSASPLGSVSVKSEDEAIVPSNAMSSDIEVNPIDLEAQEQIKHERKKLRNRLAAQRCRKRKIEREETLKIKVKELKTKNSELTSFANTLKQQVGELKQQVMRHVNEGCQVFLKENDDEHQFVSKPMLLS